MKQHTRYQTARQIMEYHSMYLLETAQCYPGLDTNEGTEHKSRYI